MKLPARPVKKSEGFTIIEVLIVLAIAGLIMVVVFLAVPALQRSGRNNALSAAANNVLSAVGSYIGNNNGTLPGDIDFPDGSTTVTISGGSAHPNANTETATVDASVVDVILGGTPITTAEDIGTIQVITGQTAKCNDTASGLEGSASARSYAVLYVAESGDGPILKCVGA